MPGVKPNIQLVEEKILWMQSRNKMETKEEEV